jgi:hypothetical protein
MPKYPPNPAWSTIPGQKFYTRRNDVLAFGALMNADVLLLQPPQGYRMGLRNARLHVTVHERGNVGFARWSHLFALYANTRALGVAFPVNGSTIPLNQGASDWERSGIRGEVNVASVGTYVIEIELIDHPFVTGSGENLYLHIQQRNEPTGTAGCSLEIDTTLRGEWFMLDEKDEMPLW